VIDPSNYYLVEHSTIHIKAGTPWTPCNTEVTYSYGTPVPAIGKMAARTLAIEFIKLWSDDDTCALPQRVTSVARQGVSYTILDQQEFIQEMRTGMYVIDLFIKTVNPDGARRKSKVFSPDQPRARRYSPKPLVLTADPEVDLVSVKGEAVTWTSVGAGLDLSNLFPDTGWDPVVSLKNYSGNKSIDLGADNISLNYGSSVVSMTIPYDKINTALGMIDPGTWTLYAIKTIDGVENIVELATGNLQIKMYS